MMKVSAHMTHGGQSKIPGIRMAMMTMPCGHQPKDIEVRNEAVFAMI